MCGITGIFNMKEGPEIERRFLQRMNERLAHRGPDEESYYLNTGIGLGFRRLSIIDIDNGHQPFFAANGQIVLICNGEIFNYVELRGELEGKGYTFTSNCDVEVIAHLYEAYGTNFLSRLNGQFSFVIYDHRHRMLFAARDQMGICPFFYTIVKDQFIFGSEIKAILENPNVKKEVDFTGLDQTLSFPGLVSPTTMFKNIISLKPGHYLLVKDGKLQDHEFWDLDYPLENFDYGKKPESHYIDKLEDLLLRSVRYRLNADVPVGFYLSGGLDSSLIAALVKKIAPENGYHSFSIGFPALEDADIDETKFQRLVADYVGSNHNEIAFDWNRVLTGLSQAVWYGECPLKETYNTCSLALSEKAKENGIKVILSGEGADELFGGYVGYRFDTQRKEFSGGYDLKDMLERQMREKLWGNPDFFYEKQKLEFQEIKKTLYSDRLNEIFNDFECLSKLSINKDKLIGRNFFHIRSYLDIKLRLNDHLIAEHCDRITYANSVEGRYPFLDIELIEFIKTIPPHLKLKGLIEKYVLRCVADKYLPDSIAQRQKFSFVAPDSQQFIWYGKEYINDLLSYETIKRQDVFNPDTIERLKGIYSQKHFKINKPYDNDLLIIVITFSMLLNAFKLSTL